MFKRVDGLALAGFLFLLFLGGNLLINRAPEVIAAPIKPQTELLEIPNPTPIPTPDPFEAIVLPPYDDYNLTQGIHGAEYGQMAIDIAAGKGTPIKSPIKGVVTDFYIDQYGNPTIILENTNFRVTLLHGEYFVTADQAVNLGEEIGAESNLGYTLDMQGRSCWNRDCGYHTHLNVFDKRLGANIDPLELFLTSEELLGKLQP